jgi:hypothetical protein
MADAIGGTHDKENAQRIAQDMESIIENGGFRFEEIVMTGDPWRQESCGKSWASGRTRRETNIGIDAKLNYGKKNYKKPDIEDIACLAEPEATLEAWITHEYYGGRFRVSMTP